MLRPAIACGEAEGRGNARPDTGLGAFWGSRLAQQIEAFDDVDVVIGVDTTEPRLPMERTEFVRTDSSYSILNRIVSAAKIDTILHTHLLVDSTRQTGRSLHEITSSAP